VAIVVCAEGPPINVLVPSREPASIDEPGVLGQQRDALHSSAIVDIPAGANLSARDARPRPLGDGRGPRPLHRR